MARTPERKVLAERWRVLGEKLRSRSPLLFDKVIEILAASDDEDEVDDPGNEEKIDHVYSFH